MTVSGMTPTSLKSPLQARTDDPTTAIDVLAEAHEATEVHHQPAVLMLRRAMLHQREVNADAVAAIVVAFRECAEAIEQATLTVTDNPRRAFRQWEDSMGETTRYRRGPITPGTRGWVASVSPRVRELLRGDAGHRADGAPGVGSPKTTARKRTSAENWTPGDAGTASRRSGWCVAPSVRREPRGRV